VAVVALLVGLAAAAAVVWRSCLGGGASAGLSLGSSGGKVGTLVTHNSAVRSGAYFLPSGYDKGPLPLLVAIHGTGSNGASMVAVFHEEADKRRFFIVAPDSRVTPDGQYSWEVGDHAGEVTDDYVHVESCVAELRAMPGVQIDPEHVLILGFSGGGSMAPYVATNEEQYTAFAVLHGGVFAGGLGTRLVRGWMSTGLADAIWPVAGVAMAAGAVKNRGFQDLTVNTFPGGHEMGADEVNGVLQWWLEK
jgi:phospholipase/carboxylesterase